MVNTSHDLGTTWKPTKTTGTILIIAPGAGTHWNTSVEGGGCSHTRKI